MLEALDEALHQTLGFVNNDADAQGSILLQYSGENLGELATMFARGIVPGTNPAVKLPPSCPARQLQLRCVTLPCR